MKTPIKILVVTVLAVGVAGAFALRKGSRPAESGKTFETQAGGATGGGPVTGAPVGARLPKLLDLGADKCIPCKMMAPILEELKKEYAGKMDVEFIDVWKNPKAARQYSIEVIPTQIFYDAMGKERFRHVGFLGKEDILAKWKEVGVELSGKSSAREN